MPEGQVTHCDRAWPGRWRPDSSDGAFEISADCRTLTTLKEGGPEQESLRLTLITSGANQFLRYRQADHDPECFGRVYCGYALYRYVRNGAEIRLYEVNHAWTASAISSGAVPGHTETADAQSNTAKQATTSETQAEPTYQNLVAGNPHQIAALLQQHPEFFNETPFLTVRRDEAVLKGDKQP
ncbi:MAG TPA: hypothetical protein VGQ93_01215 [Lysobacter sp.]|nr:hypothetical protein [Lysobacter sp.]